MNDILSQITEQFLPQMNPEERRAALNSLQAIIDREFFDLASRGDDDEDDADADCPHCSCSRVVKRGKDSRSRQRYLCRGCGRTFTATSMRVFATTKLPRETWMEFTRCHVDALTLRDSAERCGVSLKTAFFMRHRLLECLYCSMPAFRSTAGDGIELDECYVPESFKGKRENAPCGIPRKPRHHECVKDARQRICILTGVNDAGDFFYEMACRGSMDEDRAQKLLLGKIASGAIVATDCAKVYRKALRSLDVRKHISSKGCEHRINHVNGLHSRLKEFLNRFHGVATRRLENYLAWFKWIWTFKKARSCAQVADLVIKQATTNPYKTTWRNYKRTPYPFYEYWVKQAKWDELARNALPLATVSVSNAG